jgi:hypothetical protein
MTANHLIAAAIFLSIVVVGPALLPGKTNHVATNTQTNTRG